MQIEEVEKLQQFIFNSVNITECRVDVIVCFKIINQQFRISIFF